MQKGATEDGSSEDFGRLTPAADVGPGLFRIVVAGPASSRDTITYGRRRFEILDVDSADNRTQLLLRPIPGPDGRVPLQLFLKRIGPRLVRMPVMWLSVGMLVVMTVVLIASLVGVDIPRPLGLAGRILVGAVVAVSLVGALKDAISDAVRKRRSDRVGRPDAKTDGGLLSGLALRHVAWAWATGGVVLPAAIFLSSLPLLDRSASVALGGDGGNALFSLDDAAGPGWTATLATLALCGVLLLVMPRLVSSEERIFRAGSENRSTIRRVVAALVFGLVHLIMGISIGTALALSLGGWSFTLAYLHGYRRNNDPAEALAESSRVHLAYNNTLILVLVVATAVWGH